MHKFFELDERSNLRSKKVKRIIIWNGVVYMLWLVSKVLGSGLSALASFLAALVAPNRLPPAWWFITSCATRAFSWLCHHVILFVLMKNMLRHGYEKNTWLLLISTVFVTDFICGFKTATHELFFDSSWKFLPMKAASRVNDED